VAFGDLGRPALNWSENSKRHVPLFIIKLLSFLNPIIFDAHISKASKLSM